MQISVITLFPEMFVALQSGIPGRALKRDLLRINYFNPRDYATDNYQTVDDRPYGGGPGMVMKVEPLLAAVNAAKAMMPINTKVIYLSPQGTCLTQQAVRQFVDVESIILIAGRYEGIDQRFIDEIVDEEWSIGDYILSGGELAAMVMIDAIIRHLPGALGDEQSKECESFANSLLDYPVYTRPEVILDRNVPPVLLSGDHRAIEEWRAQQALLTTWKKRPDLLTQRQLTAQEQQLLNEFKQTNE